MQMTPFHVCKWRFNIFSNQIKPLVNVFKNLLGNTSIGAYMVLPYNNHFLRPSNKNIKLLPS